MKVRWTAHARERFRQDARYIARDNPTAAREVMARVRKAAQSLGSNPLKGRAGRVVDTRELVVPRTPYTIAYRVVEQSVEIVAVLHQSRQWPESFDEHDV